MIQRSESPGIAMHTHCPLVIIRWQDSAQPIPAWKHLSHLPSTRPIECATVGWLLKDDDDVKVLCQSVGDLHDAHNAQASGIMTIPARCIISIERLAEEDGLTSSAGSADIEVGSSVGQTTDSPPDLAPDLARRPRESEFLPA
jgi:hypothetical protein